MQVPIDDIKISKRIRASLGDIEGLMASLRDNGLLNPVLVSDRLELIAGQRRLEAARRLGWKTIEVTMVDGRDEADRLAMEIEENLHRLDFTPEELDRARRRLEALRNPGIFRKLLRLLRRLFQWLFEKT